jgi:hypothetical protein
MNTNQKIMTATLTKQSSPQQKAREVFKQKFNEGIRPVDGRQPIPDELAVAMVQELDLPKDALIGVIDAFLILSTHLKEAGYTNLVLLESSHQNLTPSQEKYYNSVRETCEKSNIKYYVPPMNNYNRCDMKFDVIIGNPPYQKEKQVGSQSGSANSPLWWEITERSFELLKTGGILSLITPTNHLCGAPKFTEKFLGVKRVVDLKYVDFSVSNYFNVGIDICRWVVTNSVTPGNKVSFADDRFNADTDTSSRIFPDLTLDSIMGKMYSYDGPKLLFDKKKCYQYQTVEAYLIKNNLPKEWAKDLKSASDETYCYPVNLNGKIKYSRVKWRNSGVWRVFYPELQMPTIISVDDDMEASGNVFTMTFDSEDDARKTHGYLDAPEYRWVVDQCRLSGRVMNLTNLPNAPIEEVLTAEQLSYIQSQLS